MSLFSWLFGKKKKQKAPSIPTVSARPELMEAWNDAFRLHVSQFDCFTNEEVETMIARIRTAPGGFCNMGDWFTDIYSRFFQDRDWHLPDFEKELVDDPFYTVCKKTTVANTKNILQTLNIPYDKKAKKAELMDLLLKKTDEALLVQAKPELAELFTTIRAKNKKEVFKHFMIHLQGYGNNLDRKRKAAEWKRPYRLVFTGVTPEHEKRAKAFAAAHPDAIPPFFPRDHTRIEIVRKRNGF